VVGDLQHRALLAEEALPEHGEVVGSAPDLDGIDVLSGDGLTDDPGVLLELKRAHGVPEVDPLDRMADLQWVKTGSGLGQMDSRLPATGDLRHVEQLRADRDHCRDPEGTIPSAQQISTHRVGTILEAPDDLMRHLEGVRLRGDERGQPGRSSFGGRRGARPHRRGRTSSSGPDPQAPPALPAHAVAASLAFFPPHRLGTMNSATTALMPMPSPTATPRDWIAR